MSMILKHGEAQDGLLPCVPGGHQVVKRAFNSGSWFTMMVPIKEYLFDVDLELRGSL